MYLCYTHLFPLCRLPGDGSGSTSYGGGEDHVRKFDLKNFQDEDDDKKKSAYRNSIQQQWTAGYAASIIRVWMVLNVFLCQCHSVFYAGMSSIPTQAP